jgi:glycosyltransferase involved in cell wall biosynthesis
VKTAILSLHVGGMLHYTAGIARSLSDQDDVAVFVPEETDARLFPPPIQIFRYPVPQWLSLAEIGKFVRASKTIRRIKQEILDWKPDLLHVNSGHIWYSSFLPELAEAIPTVATIHDVTPHLGEKRPHEKRKLAPILKHSRAIMVHTETLRQQAIKKWNLSPETVHVVPMCDFHVLSSFATGIPEDPNRILLFGRIRGYKGLDVMLKAMPRILEQVPDTTLVIAGQGDLKPYAELLRKHEDNVEIQNSFLTEAQTASAFEQAAVVTAPYLEASQSAVPGLAAAFLRPLVASRIGGIPEIVEHEKTGLLVSPGEPRELADAIVRLLKDEQLRRQLGDSAGRIFEEKYGPAIIGASLRKAYRSLKPDT